jgi:hypothetical protein
MRTREIIKIEISKNYFLRSKIPRGSIEEKTEEEIRNKINRILDYMFQEYRKYSKENIKYTFEVKR